MIEQCPEYIPGYVVGRTCRISRSVRHLNVALRYVLDDNVLPRYIAFMSFLICHLL